MTRYPGAGQRGIPISRRTLLAVAGGGVIAGLPTAIHADTDVTPAPAQSTVASDATAAYRLDARIDSETRALDGKATITWRNTTGLPQESLFLRCYPNADYYADGEMTVSAIRVEDRPMQATSPDDDTTVLAIPLGRSVRPQELISLDFTFRTTVPLGATGSFGIFGIDQARGSWSLADWYPILAGWEPERGAWYLDAPTPFGDPTFPETATYDLTLETPAGFTLAHTGTLVARQANASSTTSTIWHVTTGAVREFAMMLLPERSATDTDGVLRSYSSPLPLASPVAVTPVADRDDIPAVTLLCYEGEAIPELSAAILDTATTVLPHYAALLGPLEETGIIIASSHLAGANGVSWPGMICLDLTVLVRDGALGEEERPGLHFTVAHEVGHQWIGGVLGLNSNDHGFMLEGFTNAIAIGAIRKGWGPEAAIEAMGRFVAGPYSGLVRDDRDEIADQPLTDETNTVLRALAVYGKAGLGFEAIRQAMGNAIWSKALASFAATFRNRIFTPADLQSAFTGAANDPASIAALWSFWFEQTRTTLADIDAVVQGAGS